MSLFVADLINQIRKQFGTQETIVTPKSLEWSAAVVKQAYDDANWDAFGEHMTDGKSHNNAGMDKVGEEYHGGSQRENIGSTLQWWNWNDENTELVKLPIEQQTTDSLKETIYNDILGMMFDDGGHDWGHSTTFANYGDQGANDETFGVNFDKYNYAHYNFMGATQENGFADNPYILPPTSELTSQLNQAKSDLEKSKAGLAQANNDLSEKQNVLINTTSTQTNAKQALNTAQTDLANKRTVLNNAKKSVADAQNKLASDKQVQQQAQSNLQAVTADLATKQENVEKAQQAYDEAKNNNDVAKKDLEDAKNSLAQVQEKQSQAQSAYDKAMKAYNDYLAAEQAVKDAEEKAKAQVQAKAEHTYFAQTANGKVVDEKGHIMVGYTVKGNQVFNAQSKLVGILTQTSTTRRMANTVKQENAKVLPQTGDKQNNNTTVGAILVGLSSLLGLGALGKRKED
ncbi:SEC10/PgrA surface exclusion domain-containing protein [Ligilactobacillus salivarius]|nr:SEC10/PgrA surface exclusion domain-containing protein [Ligilactobacillus salivarius]